MASVFGWLVSREERGIRVLATLRGGMRVKTELCFLGSNWW